MGSTSMSKQMRRRWFIDFIKKFEDLEEENAILKLRNFELEKNVRVSKSNEDPPRNKLRKVVSESDLRKSQQIAVSNASYPRQIEGAHEEKSGISDSLMSEGVDSGLDEIHVKEETANGFIQDNLEYENDIPSMDEDMDIDIKDEDVGFGQTRSNSDVVNFVQDPITLDPVNAEESSGTPFKLEIDENESIQLLFRSANQVSTTEPFPDHVHMATEVGTNHETIQSSSKYITRNVVRQELANPQPQVSSRRLFGQKRPTTQVRGKIHTCKKCSARFEAKHKLMEHDKWHTGEKRFRRRNLKTRFKCSGCEVTFSALSILTAHLRTHTAVECTGGKPSTSLQVGKRSLTVEKVNPRGRPKKKQKVCNKEKLQGVEAVKRIDSVDLDTPEMPTREPAVPGPSKPKSKQNIEAKVFSNTKLPPSSIHRPLATKAASKENVVEKKQGQVKKSKSMPELSKKTSRVKKVPESQGYFTEYAARRAMQAKKINEYRKQLSADESNEEEGEEFTFAGHNLTARYAGPQSENVLLRELYNTLPPRRKLEIDGLKVSMFYPTISSWRAMNTRILELFKKKLENTCAICSFYGLKKQNATDVVPPPFDPFNDQSHYIRHYHKFHKRKWRCTICGLTDDTSKKISAHLDEMLSKPNEAHRDQHERDGIGKRGASTSKRHIPTTTAKKPREYFIRDTTESDEEDEETESDTPPPSDTPTASPKQPPPKSSKQKVVKGKTSKKTANVDSEDNDDEFTYETAEKKNPKKKKRQN